MKKSVLTILLTALLALPSCSSRQEETRLAVVCTTYPIYLFASALTEGVEGVTVERLNTGSTSCLHDYTLSMADMKKLERADVLALNGAGLEEFLEGPLDASNAQVIDCSEGVELLENLSHRHDADEADGHDHGHWDPHYWMDPSNAILMTHNLEEGLSKVDQDHAPDYHTNALHLGQILNQCEQAAWEAAAEYAPKDVSGLITFHDGFQYFAKAFDMNLLASIEEEAGSEASAKEIVEITQLVKSYGIPVIFTEVNGSDATANAIARETGCTVAQLTMLMEGPDDLEAYCDGIVGNIRIIHEKFTSGEGTTAK